MNVPNGEPQERLFLFSNCLEDSPEVFLNEMLLIADETKFVGSETLLSNLQTDADSSVTWIDKKNILKFNLKKFKIMKNSLTFTLTLL